MKLESLSVSLQPSPSPEPVTVAKGMAAVHTFVWPMAALTCATSFMVSSRAPKRTSTLLSSCCDIGFLLFILCYIRSPRGRQIYGQNVSSSEPPLGRWVNVSWHGGPDAL